MYTHMYTYIYMYICRRLWVCEEERRGDGEAARCRAQISMISRIIYVAVGYQPTLASEMGAFQERIVATTAGSITSYVDVYIYIYIYIYTHTYLPTCVRSYILTYIHVIRGKAPRSGIGHSQTGRWLLNGGAHRPRH